MNAVAPQIVFFPDSPDDGLADCICSWCQERIEAESDEPDEDTGAVRLWKKIDGVTHEARFHPRCFNECIELGLITFSK